MDDASESFACTYCSAQYIKSIRPTQNNTRMTYIQFTTPVKDMARDEKR